MASNVQPGMRHCGDPGCALVARRALRVVEIAETLADMVETLLSERGTLTRAIRREFGVAVKARTLRRWLRRIGFSWRKDRYVPYKSASKREQEEFNEAVRECAAQRRAGGMTVFVEDKAAVQRSQNLAYGWRPSGGGGTSRQGRASQGRLRGLSRCLQ